MIFCLITFALTVNLLVEGWTTGKVNTSSWHIYRFVLIGMLIVNAACVFIARVSKNKILNADSSLADTLHDANKHEPPIDRNSQQPITRGITKRDRPS